VSWNYRVVSEETEEGIFYGIAEVYYDEKQVPVAYCYVNLDSWESMEALDKTLELIIQARIYPVIKGELMNRRTE